MNQTTIFFKFLTMKLVNNKIVVAMPCYKLAQCNNADDILLLVCEQIRESSMYSTNGGIIIDVEPRAFVVKNSPKVQLGIKGVFYARLTDVLRVECWTVANITKLLGYVVALNCRNVDLSNCVEMNAVLDVLSFETIDTSNKYARPKYPLIFKKP